MRDIKGQGNAVRYLSNSIRSGDLSKSYLFSGPEGVGRALSAKAFIKALICRERSSSEDGCSVCPACKKADALTHPDITWIKPEKNKAIKIEEIRAVRDALSLKPFESPLGVCVIEDAHCMTVAASNALLKVLEEPNESSMLVLITSKRELLLSTIISRCSEVRFNALPIAETKRIIEEKAEGINGKDAEMLAYFSQGSPGRALEIISEGLEEKKKDIISIMAMVEKADDPAGLDWIHEDKDAIMEDIDMLIMFLRDAVVGAEGGSGMMIDKGFKDTAMYGFLSGYNADNIYKMTERLIEMRNALVSNVNPKMVAQMLPGTFQ
ncbi:MAG: DNA polymerase III subunit delta' [Candidatus Omnitrophota bacterium]|nr:DNA polymerase III subunit delta' [Candidatus Omnitrophota bacterium]